MSPTSTGYEKQEVGHETLSSAPKHSLDSHFSLLASHLRYVAGTASV